MQIHLLGYSEATISRILDVFSVTGEYREVVIVQNMEVEKSIPFCPPEINYRIIDWKEWKFDRKKQLCFPGVMNPSTRQKVVDFFRENCGVKEEDYANVIHPQSVIASTVKLGRGIMIEPGSVLASFAKLGFGAYINRGCTVGHHAVIGDNVMTGPGVHIAGHCRLGKNVKMGIGSVVFDHVTIGENTIVGGGSVVNRDLPADVMAWGNPCKVIKSISLNEA
jgi:sugar O-acyltransferase (sialic acid O-acetyltransferase NeuD family)